MSVGPADFFKMTSTITIIPTQQTTIDLKINTQPGETNIDAMSAVRVVVEGVSGCDLMVKAYHKNDDVWSVTFPSMSMLESDTIYTTRVEVVVNGQLFSVPTGTTVVSESVNSGNMTAPGPDMQITNRFTGEPEEPIEAKLQYPVGQNNDEHLDDEDYQEYNQDKTEDIASETTPGEGPQIPQVPTPAEVAARIVSQVMGQIRKPETKGTLFDRDASGKPIVKGLEDPKTRAKQLERSQKVRDVLGLD